LKIFSERRPDDIKMSEVEERKLLFITGLSGSGKTTLGEKLKNENGFIHFNVDIWAFGGDPVEQSASVPTPAMMEKRDPVIKEAFDNMAANGFRKLAAGESVSFEIWEKFFSLLVPAIKNTQEKTGNGKNLVITFSVYCRSVRDYLRSQLGEKLAFIVLNPSVENVGFRKVQHLRNTASERGQTLSQFLRSFNPNSDAPDLEENVIVEMLTSQARAGAVGFEPAAADEPRTLAVGDMSVDEIHQTVLEFIKTL
jgi:gluconate kinase